MTWQKYFIVCTFIHIHCVGSIPPICTVRLNSNPITHVILSHISIHLECLHCFKRRQMGVMMTLSFDNKYVWHYQKDVEYAYTNTHFLRMRAVCSSVSASALTCITSQSNRMWMSMWWWHTYIFPFLRKFTQFVSPSLSLLLPLFTF